MAQDIGVPNIYRVRKPGICGNIPTGFVLGRVIGAAGSAEVRVARIKAVRGNVIPVNIDLPFGNQAL